MWPFTNSHCFIKNSTPNKVLHLCKHLCDLAGMLKVSIFTKCWQCKETFKDIIPLCIRSRTSTFYLWIHEWLDKHVEFLNVKSFGWLLKRILEFRCPNQIILSQRKLVARTVSINGEKNSMSPLMKKNTVFDEGIITQRNPMLSILSCSDYLLLRNPNKEIKNRTQTLDILSGGI